MSIPLCILGFVPEFMFVKEEVQGNMEVQGVNIGLQGQIAVDYPQSQQSVPADERVVPKQESSPVNPYDKRSQGDDFFTKKISSRKS